MGPHDYSDPIVIPITLTVPDPRPRPRSGRWDLGASHHPSFADPDWFQRQGTREQILATAGRSDDPAAPTVSEFKQAMAWLRRESEAPVAEAGPAPDLSARQVEQDTQVAALGKYAGPPLPPDVQEAFDDLFATAQELANSFFLKHPDMIKASPAAIGSVLHTDFERAVKSENDPRLRVEFSRSFGYGVTRGALGSVRNDIEYIDPVSEKVLAVLDYKTTADPDATPGDILSIGAKRTEQIRKALAERGKPIDSSVPIVGIRVIVGKAD